MKPAQHETEITFRRDFDCWWPIYDHNPEACFKRVTTRIRDLDTTISLARQHHVVVQAGGHAGFWPLYLARSFENVYTFEPDHILFRCLERNTFRYPVENRRIKKYNMALGAEMRDTKMRRHRSVGSWRVDDVAGTDVIRMVTIDHLALEACDALVLDVEGYELDVLKGAVKTLARFKPVVHLEVLTGSQERYDRAMGILGYRLNRKVHADAIYTPA